MCVCVLGFYVYNYFPILTEHSVPLNSCIVTLVANINVPYKEKGTPLENPPIPAKASWSCKSRSAAVAVQNWQIQDLPNFLFLL